MGNSSSNLQPKPRPAVLQRIYADEKQMRKYNICPRHLANIKMTSQLARVILKQRHRIKSLKLQENSALTKSSLVRNILPKMDGLKSISINLSRGYIFKTGNKDVRILSKALAQTKHLKSCNIENSPLEYSDDYYLSIIMLSVNTLKELHRVDYWYNPRFPNYSSLEASLLRFSHLKKLEKLNLNLENCNPLSKQTLIKLAMKLEDLPNLTEFGFDVDFTQLTETVSSEGMILFFESIAKKNLTSLNLKFKGEGFSPEHMIPVCQNISQISGLSSLSLTFYYVGDFQKKGLSYLTLPLNSLKNLTQLKIHLYWNDQPRRFSLLKGIVDGIFFKRITYLDLRFCDNGLSDDTIRDLSDSLSKFINLQSLALSLWSQRAVSDATLESLMKNVEKLTNLNTLGLDFLVERLDDKQMVWFAPIASMKKIKSLELRFRWNGLITDKGLLILSSYLARLKQLVTLEMGFNGCRQVSRIGVDQMISVISLNKRLKHARFIYGDQKTINFYSPNFIKEEGVGITN